MRAESATDSTSPALRSPESTVSESLLKPAAGRIIMAPIYNLRGRGYAAFLKCLYLCITKGLSVFSVNRRAGTVYERLGIVTQELHTDLTTSRSGSPARFLAKSL